MRLETGVCLVALGLAFFGPVLTAMTLPPASARVALPAEIDREPPSAAPAIQGDLDDVWRARLGPLYGPAEGGDTGALEELTIVYGAEARPAIAYALAHATGRHVERLLGVAADPRALELEADCLAGVSGALSPSDARAAIAAAASVARSRHARLGTADEDLDVDVSTEERVAAFTDGFTSRDLATCAQSGRDEGSDRIAPVKRARR